MRAGRLDRRIVIQGKTASQSDSGEVTESWLSFPARPASYSPLSGDERYNDPQFVAREQVEFRVRWASAIANINALNRIIYPASSLDDDPIQDGNIYDVITVHEIGRREGLQIIAARRIDTVAVVPLSVLSPTLVWDGDSFDTTPNFTVGLPGGVGNSSDAQIDDVLQIDYSTDGVTWIPYLTYVLDSDDIIAGEVNSQASANPLSPGEYRFRARLERENDTPSSYVTTTVTVEIPPELVFTFLGHAEDTGDKTTGQSYTFVGKDLGSDAENKIIAVGVNLRAGGVTGTSAVTVDGISAVLRSESKSQPTSQNNTTIWEAQGVFNPTGDIVVTVSGSPIRCGITWSSVFDGEFDSETHAPDNSGASMTSLSLTGIDGSVIIGCSGAPVTAGTPGITWTGLDVVDLAALLIEGTQYHAAAHSLISADGAVTLGATWSGTVSAQSTCFVQYKTVGA